MYLGKGGLGGGPAICAASDTPHCHLARKHFPLNAIYGVFFLLMEFMEYNRCPEPPSPQAPLTCTTTAGKREGGQEWKLCRLREFLLPCFFILLWGFPNISKIVVWSWNLVVAITQRLPYLSIFRVWKTQWIYFEDGSQLTQSSRLKTMVFSLWSERFQQVCTCKTEGGRLIQMSQ